MNYLPSIIVLLSLITQSSCYMHRTPPSKKELSSRGRLLSVYVACEEYYKHHGEYPPVTNDEKNWRQALLSWIEETKFQSVSEFKRDVFLQKNIDSDMTNIFCYRGAGTYWGSTGLAKSSIPVVIIIPNAFESFNDTDCASDKLVEKYIIEAHFDSEVVLGLRADGSIFPIESLDDLKHVNGPPEKVGSAMRTE